MSDIGFVEMVRVRVRSYWLLSLPLPTLLLIAGLWLLSDLRAKAWSLQSGALPALLVIMLSALTVCIVVILIRNRPYFHGVERAGYDAGALERIRSRAEGLGLFVASKSESCLILRPSRARLSRWWLYPLYLLYGRSRLVEIFSYEGDLILVGPYVKVATLVGEDARAGKPEMRYMGEQNWQTKWSPLRGQILLRIIIIGVVCYILPFPVFRLVMLTAVFFVILSAFTMEVGISAYGKGDKLIAVNRLLYLEPLIMFSNRLLQLGVSILALYVVLAILSV